MASDCLAEIESRVALALEGCWQTPPGGCATDREPMYLSVLRDDVPWLISELLAARVTLRQKWDEIARLRRIALMAGVELEEDDE